MEEMEYNYGDNIDYDKLFRMLITASTKPICVYGYIPLIKCYVCDKELHIIDNIDFYGIRLSKYEIHDYLYHNMKYSNNIKKILYEYRDIISDRYNRYLLRL